MCAFIILALYIFSFRLRWSYCPFLRMRCVRAVLCGIVLLMHVMITNSQTSDNSPSGDCSQFASCDSCISGDPTLNLTRCVWQSCNKGNDTRCISDTEDFGDCSVFNKTGMCQIDSSTSDDGGKGDLPLFFNLWFVSASVY
ncbi:uncharacterized protein LOC127425452 [Myxocyprinus asiaticus]|uniref:uncharacterized protein LOC127425452 n=1 Tax=Myxocyprinus asiaticus TaxID=70543 RepID=UPI0022230058|nr:uncharacterized protein LOC127425452 [Myxocyprinus asiaticus]